MILSELLEREVVDERGHRLGIVHDVRLSTRLPVGGGNRADLTIEALVVGRSGLAARLGYGPNGVRGPWLLSWLAARLERRVDEIPWPDVIWTDGPGQLVVRRRQSAVR